MNEKTNVDRHRVGSVVFALIFVVAPILFILWLKFAVRNPLEKYGVHVVVSVGGTGSYPTVDVWVDYNGKKVEPPIPLGGIGHAVLSFKDVDGDGVPDIILSNDSHRQIVAFKPHASKPEDLFVVIEDNPEYHY